jgi:hypothetical protein
MAKNNKYSNPIRLISIFTITFFFLIGCDNTKQPNSKKVEIWSGFLTDGTDMWSVFLTDSTDGTEIWSGFFMDGTDSTDFYIERPVAFTILLEIYCYF